MKTINIIATTISGSLKDWKKIDSIPQEFEKHYSGEVKLHLAHSHDKAKVKAQELIEAGERIIVSAGGAGTFNSILEGTYLKSGFPKGLRLAFLRKGSADLMGKVLQIPDDVSKAAKVITNAIVEDKTLTSDVIEIKINDEKRHIIGFSGIGIFGIVPYFTESKLIKYYKGFLGSLFGDRGPFLVGANLALVKYYFEKLYTSKEYDLVVNGTTLDRMKCSSIIIANGDLGSDFPIAKNMPFGNKEFRILLIEDRGIWGSYKQLINIWNGDFEKKKGKLGIESVKAQNLKIIPKNNFSYLVNIDGLYAKTNSDIEFTASGQIKLLTG